MAARVLETLSEAVPMESGEHREAEDRIAELYEIVSRRVEVLEPESAAEDPELSRAWAELRRLQTEEADRYQRDFEASLVMPIDAWAALLAQAREMRREFEAGL